MNDAEVANPLQSLLERAVRESLRELARSAAAEDGVGAPHSIECIVRSVAARLAEDAGAQLVLDQAHIPHHEPSKCAPPPPMLSDLQPATWLLWQETSPSGMPGLGFGQCQALRRSPPPTTQTRTPKSLASCPSTGAVSTYGAESNAESDASTTDAPGADEESVTEDAGRGRARFVDQKSVAGSVTPGQAGSTGRRRTSRGKPSPSDRSPGSSCGHRSLAASHGASPLRISEGLTLDTNRAQHLMMQWQGRPGTVLLVAKPGDRLVTAQLQDIAVFLSSQGVVVVLEPQLLADEPDLKTVLPHVRTFSVTDELEKHVDLVITIGGDGTLTWAVSRFRGAVPPVLSFAAGSLGFLTPFPLDGWVRTLTNIISIHQTPVPLVCRMRLKVVVRRRTRVGGCGAGCTPAEKGDEGTCQVVHCLNEVLVHRGHSGALAKLDVAVDGEKVTVLQGDGVILATPTGSTAYSLAAGGSMVHPGVPGILLTPVSPHSLSFRPAVLPDSAVVTVSVPLTARSGAALSVDGKDLCVLGLGDSVEVSTSPHPVPTICRTTGTADWFASVHNGLQWNGRVEQK